MYGEVPPDPVAETELVVMFEEVEEPETLVRLSDTTSGLVGAAAVGAPIIAAAQRMPVIS